MKETVNWAEVPAAQYPILKNKVKTPLFWIKDGSRQSIYVDPKTRNYYHKDPLHGEVEVYDTRGRHIKVLLPTGEEHPVRKAKKGRSINAFL